MFNKLVSTIWLLAYSSLAFADNTATLARPVPPSNNCGQYSIADQYQQYLMCTSEYNRKMVVYQNEIKAYNQMHYQNPSAQIAVNNNGMLSTPTAPINTCGNQPEAGDSGYSQWQTCDYSYQSQMNAYNQAMNNYNFINGQISNSAALQQQQQQQTTQAQQLASLTDNTVTGQLNQVQQKTDKGISIYQIAGTALMGYAMYNAGKGTMYSGQCGSQNYAACAAAVVSFAAAAAFTGLGNKANDQVQDFGQNKVQVCQTQNDLSGGKQNCDFLTPGSPVVIPSIETPPDPSWFDPQTGACKPTAPKICDQSMNSDEYKASGLTVPKLGQPVCAGGGTACMASLQPTVVQTPKGPKYVIKGKDGKEFSMYASDLQSEKALMAAGLSAADAKKTKAMYDAAMADTKKALAGIDKSKGKDDFTGFGTDTKTAFSGGAGSTVGFGDADAAAKAARKFKDDLAAAKMAARGPSAAAGLSKDFHGDLIGSAGDDIFTMMNRRYQLKDEQDTFLVP